MAGYASDQFFNFNNYEVGKSIGRTSDDNPNFNYPSNRTSPVFTDDKGKYTSVPIQRGFIKGIYPSALGKVSTDKVKQRRLFFQFNPTTLDRTVSMATSVLNPLLQDPSNLLQPVPGSSDFSFDILFNRESEVASGRYSDINSVKRKAGSLTGSLEEYGTNTKQSDVSNLGVLADLYVLDSIIGQSITPDMIDFLKDYWNNASTISQASYEAGDGSASFSFNSDEFTKTVKKNYGNAAFLSPLPIRIVFSSLFMVEGFVTTSSVQFIKFTSNYVPTICKVTLNIRALYIGFAKEKAYLTDALDTAVKDAQEQKKKDAAAQLAAKGALQKGTSLVFGTGPVELKTKFVDNLGNENEATTTLAQSAGSIYEWYNTSGTGTVAIQGTLKSRTLFPMQNLVKKDGAKWDFSAALAITEVLKEERTDIDGNKYLTRILFQAPLTYKTYSQNNDITSTKIAENANKTTDTPTGPGDPNNQTARENNDRWYCSGKKSLASVLEKDSTIEFTMTVIGTISFTLPSGTESTETYTRMFTYALNADNAEGKARGLKMHAGTTGYIFDELNIN
jgi:hypothetical protein